MAKIGDMLKAVRAGGGLAGRSNLQVRATVEVPSKNMPVMSTKYDREEVSRLTKEIKGIQQALDEWVPEDVAARAKRSLELELQAKKARLIESRIRVKQNRSCDCMGAECDEDCSCAECADDDDDDDDDAQEAE
jgi:hypothetical protein